MNQIGPYQIISELGQGGMAKVYRALQPSVNRVVALKVLPAHLESDETSVRRFRQEAETAANLAHDNIVKVWDASVSEPPYYIAMQFLDSGTLGDRLANGPLPVEEAIRIITQLCSALDHAHQRSIVHRDIKPANVMFDGSDRPVLTDFGIAKATEQTRLTAVGAKFGTPDYMSPEQAKGLPVDYRSDLYSIAVVLYELLTGRTTFVNDEPLVTMTQIVNEQPTAPRLFNPNIPPAVEAVLLQALAKNPNERYQSGAAFAEALWSALRSPDTFVPPVTLAPPAHNLPPTIVSGSAQVSQVVGFPGTASSIAAGEVPVFADGERRRKMLMLGLLVVVVAAALAAYFGFRGSRPQVSTVGGTQTGGTGPMAGRDGSTVGPPVIKAGPENGSRSGSDSYNDLVREAIIHIGRSDYKKALAATKSAILLNPNGIAAYNAKITALNKLGTPENLKEAYATALEATEKIDSKDAQAWLSRAILEYNSHKYSDALASVEIALNCPNKELVEDRATEALKMINAELKRR